ncbi:MAG: phosphatase PAP2 family protein [Candidatus Woesearchaeota archaeon]
MMMNKRTTTKTKNQANINNKIIFLILIGAILTTILFFIDEIVMKFINSLHTPSLINIFKAITLLGEIEIFIPALIIVSIIFYFTNKKITGIWIATIATGILSVVLKIITNRIRPFENSGMESIVNTSLSSFPSGHSMIIFCLLPFLIKNYPGQKIYFWTIALLVAFSRIYLNVHYLSDVVAGAFIGYIIGIIVLQLAEKYNWK